MGKLKTDDRGITLVEIIVSIAILAIIVLPFLNAFVTATKTNVKAKNEMNATHLATNIMEGIEKNSMKTLAYQFNYPNEGFDVSDGFNMSDGSNACELLKKSGGYKDVTKFEDVREEVTNKDDLITSTIHKSDASATIDDTSLWKFVEGDVHKYYFYMSGIKSGSKTYNALVTVNARADSKENTGNATDGQVSKYNMDEVADMSAMDVNFDCMSADKMSAQDVLKTLSDRGYTGLSQNNVKRRITIDIENSSSTKVTVSYSYEFNYGGSTVTFPNDTTMKESYTTVIYDNSVDPVNQTLRNIYLFYRPWYTSTSNTGYEGCDDVIVINNKDKVDCTVNIVKQKFLDPTELKNKESSYKVYVKVNELGNRTGTAYTHIATNLDINMADSDNTIQPKQAIYGFNTNVNQEQVRGIVDIKNLTKDDAKDRLYDVKVDIYESKTGIDEMDATTPVVSMTGSMGY